MSSSRTHEQSSSVRQNLQLAALGYGIAENRLAIVKQCIEDGVDVNAITPFSEVRPLELALEKCNVSIMSRLLDAGADTEETSTQGSTILMNACKYGFLECVKLLVEHEADLYALDVDSKTCLHVALEKGHYSVASCLLIHDAYEEVVRPSDGLCLLQHLILTDDAALISNLKHCEVDLDASCPDGNVALFFALKHHKNKSLKGLLKAGANPNVRNADRNCALHEAVRKRRTRAVKYLMAYGADAQMLNKDSLTPIEIAFSKQSLSMMRLLLDCGADIEQKCAQGSTPLIAACSVGYLEGVHELIELGANLKARSKNGDTCLLAALDGEHHSVADYLLDQDECEVNGIGREGLSALHHAILLNNADLMRRLIQKQADVNIQNRDNEAPVYLAVKYGRLNLLDMLLKAGANPNINTKDDNFALHEAVKHCDLEAVKLLLQHGADKDRINKNGITAVQVAVALVPPPQDIIHCLLTDYMDTQEPNSVASLENPDEKCVEHRSGNNKHEPHNQLQQSLCCPITLELMKDPVIASDGHTYERKAIEEWVSERNVSPVTRQPMNSSTLVPNLAIKHMIDQFTNMECNP